MSELYDREEQRRMERAAFIRARCMYAKTVAINGEEGDDA
jgi:hypothetical protein